ncbi:MAG: hypothetical protein EOL88_10510 [Bacteroidia bacterium]|nr:helix-turn-helix domain-containing protein [Bacteroidales bacterium]NCD42512.1 hypothetical protein [Bacteroidia bacterium]MDD3010702.1 helix-turn-helix domain-containing protein [Bacteroidales bacterium]MDD3962673.1 helix-turn-helix domain-containing protein [Bacteroidales bacterium]MDY0285138.1 helix-turn-helix domain-containing protein [Bacteroidales bacterium]
MRTYNDKQIELEAYQYYLSQVNRLIIKDPDNSLNRQKKSAALRKIAELQGSLVDEDKYISEVANYFGIDAQSIYKPDNRKRSNAEPRLVAVYVLKKITGKSDLQLAIQFNYKNHSSISYAVKQTENLIFTDPNIRKFVDHIFSN